MEGDSFESFVEGEKGINLEITMDDILEVELPLEGLEYKGEGATSFSSKYDEQKAEHLKSFGIETEGLDHAELGTSFIIFSHICALELVKREGGDLEKALKTANLMLEGRIDRFGLRDDLGNGNTYESARKALGFASNSECKVSEEEFSNLLKNTLTGLKRKN